MGKTYRVGILGAENSHASAFSGIFNAENGKYPDIKVVGVGGIYPEENKKVAEKYGIGLIAEKPEDMIGKIDALMVTARDGAYHAPFAAPFIERGIPAFIDKPFTRSYAEAEKLVALAKQKDVPLTGGSSVKSCYDVRMLRYLEQKAEKAGELHGGNVTAPLSMENEYGGFWFYASHLAEISLSVFGYDPVAVTAFRRQNDVIALVDYEHFSVTNAFVDGCYSYNATIYRKGKDEFRDIDIGMCYEHECEEFSLMLTHGIMTYSYDQLIKPVRYLEAIKESFETGKTVEI